MAVAFQALTFATLAPFATSNSDWPGGTTLRAVSSLATAPAAIPPATASKIQATMAAVGGWMTCTPFCSGSRR